MVLVTVVTVLLWAYWPGWVSLFSTWASDPDYNHGFLVIPIAIWLLWQRRELLSSITITPSWWGLGFLIAAGGLRWAGAEFFISQLEVWSIPLWIAGVVLLFGGWQLLRWSAGAIAFLWFMTPLPASLTNFVSLPLQRVSAVLSTWTLHLFAQPAIRQGNVISLGDEVMNVERACSGLRICYGILALAVAYVILVKPGRIRSGILLAASLPVAILANSLRVTVTGLLFLVVSGDAAHKYAHDYAGLLMLPMAVLMLWLVHLVIDRVASAFQRSANAGSLMLVKAAAAIILVGSGLVFWQARQAEFAVQTLLQIAARHEANAQQYENDQMLLEAAGEWQKAGSSLDKFCRSRPDDAAAAKRLAQSAERLAFTKPGRIRATRYTERAWDLTPEDTELGFKVVYLAMGAELYRDVIDATQKLQQLPLNQDQRLNAFQLMTRAMSQDAEGTGADRTTWDELLAKLKEGIAGGLSGTQKDELDAVTCSFQAAMIYRQRAVKGVSPAEGIEESNVIMRELIEGRPNDPLAWFARYAFRKLYPSSVDSQAETGRAMDDAVAPSVTPNLEDVAEADTAAITADGQILPPDADSDLDRAIELAESLQDSKVLPIWLAAGDRAVARNDYESAAEFYVKGTQTNPDHFRSYLQLARLKTGLGGRIFKEQDVTPEQRAAAIKILKSAFEREGLDNELLLQVELIGQQLQSGNSDQIAQANTSLTELKTQMNQMPADVGLPLQLNLAVVEAEVYMNAKDPARATKVLETVLGQEGIQSVDPETLSNSWLLLASCYEQQGLTDKAQEYVQKAITQAPASPGTKWFQARTAEQANDLGLAAQLYSDVANQLGNRPQAWIAAARTELLNQKRPDVSQRDFSKVAKSLSMAKAAGAEVSEIAVVEADYWSSIGDTDKAIKVLRQAAESEPNSPAIWRGLALLSSTADSQAESNAALERFREVAESSVEAVLLEADLLAGREMWPDIRQLLDQAIQDTPELETRRQLVNRYVQIELRASEVENAQRILEIFAQQNPDDIPVQVQLANFYWRQRDLEKMHQVEENLQRAEGKGGIFWQELRARRLVESAIRDSDPDQRDQMIAEAKTITGKLKSSDEIRAAVFGLQGRIAAVEGKYAEAAAYLETAWKQNPGSVFLASELIFSFRAAGNVDKANSYLLQLRNLIPDAPQLFDLALDMQSPVVMDDRRASETLARDWTQSIGDAVSYRRLAQMLSMSTSGSSSTIEERLAETESAYRKAIELAPSDVGTWAEFLRFLYRGKNSSAQAMLELDALLIDENLSELDRAFTAATLLTEMGQRSQASRFWHLTVDRAGTQEDATTLNRVLSSAAVFFLNSDLPMAEVLAQRAYLLRPDEPTNRRLLLTVLTAVNTPESLRKAKPIIDAMGPAANNRLTDADRRTLARALYRRAESKSAESNVAVDLKNATALLNVITQPVESDAVQLAQIAGLQGNQLAALQSLSEVAGRRTANPTTIQTFVEYWQDHYADTDVLSGRVQDALTKLEQTSGAETLALQLRLRPEGLDADQTETMSREFLQKVGAYRRTPDSQQQLLTAVFLQLIRTDRGQMILELCLKDLPSYTIEQKLNATLLAAIVSPGTAQFEQELQNLLADELPKLDTAIVDRSAADYYFLRANWEQAKRYYRRCLIRSAADAGVLNNLALLVAEDDQDFDEAELLLQRAEIVLTDQGANANYLQDTRAMLLLKRKQPEAAYAILTQLAQSVSADASVFLHLAECARQLERKEEAHLSLQIARQMGIADTIMPSLDRDLYEDLSLEYPQQANGSNAMKDFNHQKNMKWWVFKKSYPVSENVLGSNQSGSHRIYPFPFWEWPAQLGAGETHRSVFPTFRERQTGFGTKVQYGSQGA